MVGHLKVVGVIHQCTRCFALRNLLDESAECPTCKALLNETTTTTRTLPLSDVSSDERPLGGSIAVLSKAAMKGAAC